MNTEPQETKFESLKVKTSAKEKLGAVMSAIQAKRGVKPTMTEVVVIMADHFLATA
jgi:hypothetical protein